MSLAVDKIPKRENINWSCDGEGTFSCHWQQDGEKYTLTFGSNTPNNMPELVAALNEAMVQPEDVIQEIENSQRGCDYSECMKGVKLPNKICR